VSPTRSIQTKGGMTDSPDGRPARSVDPRQLCPDNHLTDGELHSLLRRELLEAYDQLNFDEQNPG